MAEPSLPHAPARPHRAPKARATTAMQKRKARGTSAFARRMLPGPHLPPHALLPGAAAQFPQPPPHVPAELTALLLALQRLWQVHHCRVHLAVCR